MTILINIVYTLNRNKLAKLYLPSMFQTSDIVLLRPKIETWFNLTKSPKRDHIYKYMLEEHNFLTRLGQSFLINSFSNPPTLDLGKLEKK